MLSIATCLVVVCACLFTSVSSGLESALTSRLYLSESKRVEFVGSVYSLAAKRN